jgi:threonine synthase
VLVDSTRSALAVPITDAIEQGLAPDGGLYVPAQLPKVNVTARALPEVAAQILAPFFDQATWLTEACQRAFDFPAPLTQLPTTGDHLLELFHGPTAAFKDYGARFLSELLSRRGAGEQTVLVATSGDTGAAVAGAFAGRPGFRVVVLYPDGRVSPRQAHQLGAFGGNVRALRVTGSFDDCQALVKAAFADAALRKTRGLRSANSISLGRLLPQIAYYAQASLTFADRGLGPVSFVIPTGNLGNAVACLYARAMGLPIGKVVLATNANRVLVDWLAGSLYQPGPSRSTLANAMDVGAPSNLERVTALLPDAAARAGLAADSVSDEEIRATIARTHQTSRLAICPHTACGVEVLRRLRAQGERGTWVVAATAHAAKFETIVEPIIGRVLQPPPALAALLSRPSHAEPMPADLAALRERLA